MTMNETLSMPPFLAGTVSLVGAGPGDPSHLTLLAVDRLRQADVVLHDALVMRDVLALACASARVIDVGRRKGDPETKRALSTSLMIHEAKAGHRVVRLHGGDSGVFGRVQDEVTELVAANVAYEIVPGVSAVLAAPAAAGIGLTWRGVARGFRVRTGHVAEGARADVEPDRGCDTLVVLMGLEHAHDILATLIAEGYAPNTPAVAVDQAGRKGERVVAGTLENLDQRIARAHLVGPTTLIVGSVASYARESRASDAVSKPRGHEVAA